MTVALNSNTIGNLARAIFAQLSPLSGTRGTGTATFTAAAGGGDITLPANTYLVPIINGEAMPHRLYKVAPNPATLTNGSLAVGVWCGGDWTVPEGGTLSVNVTSNVGGADQNLPAGATLLIDEPIAGISAPATLAAAVTDGANTHLLCSTPLLTRFVFWQQLSPGESAADFFRAGAGSFPALLMVWTKSQTLQGRTSGGRQGNTRLERGERAFREGFIVYVGTGRNRSAEERRNAGLVAMQAVTRLLSDQQNNRDQEPLSSMGAGLEITNRVLTVAAQEHFIYQLELEANAVISKTDERTFGPWAKTAIQALAPGREDPEPTTPLTLLDVVDDMP